jgi:hypothetical protein
LELRLREDPAATLIEPSKEQEDNHRANKRYEHIRPGECNSTVESGGRLNTQHCKEKTA